ncbi:MocR-like pyridoxine biosynthesis transcription factor PdxR [Lysinibacillus sp. 54212]|uniref:MocR-like pyridoxine biosynthesis transcription factor PdxR n=1 Tax=Lysinibacillus sp. 54212 TaxID=3119829 RepID=UPI002FC949CE
MEIQIVFTSNVPKYIEIYKQMKQLILKQHLKTHTKIPTKRQLAQQLNISIHTVQTAYEQLLSEGYIYAIERKGYFVSKIDFDWHGNEVHEVETPKKTEKPPLINFHNGQVDAIQFPFRIWQRLYKNHLVATSVPNANWQGEVELRQEIAYYLQQARAINCKANQIFIFSGTQQQLQSLCTFLHGVRVGIEHPGFSRAYTLFQQLKLPTALVPLDSEGCTVPTEPINLLYATPAHQYPLGQIMSINRRLQLLQWAKSTNSYIIEDDYDSEFRYKGAPIPPLAHLDGLDRVIYFGTFSKTLLPSIRVSYMVLPTHLLSDFEAFNQLTKSTVSRIDQLVIADFMKSGEYAKHIAKMRTLYRAKRKCLIDAITQHFGPSFSVLGDDAGLHVVLSLPPHLTEEIAIRKAASVGVAVDAISQCFQLEKPKNQILIGYGTPTIEEIQKGVQLLASVYCD